MLATRQTKRKSRRPTRAERRAVAERVEKGALMGVLLLAYYAAFGGASNEATVLGCAMCALIFAAVSFCMFVFFAFGGRVTSALCWILAFCASSLVFIQLT
jgi:hypothetical protein